MWHSLAFTLCGISALIQVSVQGPYQRTLLKNLLKDYNRMERPVANDSQPLTVFLSMSLIQIMDVDEKNQVLTSNIWLNMHWYDHYLQWNQSEYPGVKNLRFTTDQVWTPDILLYNSADDKFDSTFKSNIVVNSSGYCNYLPPGIFMSTCNVDVRWFPFDIQKCELKFGSWTFDGWLLDLQMNEADISGYMPNGEWDLVGVPGTRNELYYDCCKEPYPDVTFVVTIRRRTLYYALNLLIPCVLLSSMTLLIFLLPADSGEKISLGITVLLSLTVFMLLVAEIMPATSDSIPLIGQYFASIMIIVGMSVIATVVVLQYHHHDPNGGNMPKWSQGSKELKKTLYLNNREKSNTYITATVVILQSTELKRDTVQKKILKVFMLLVAEIMPATSDSVPLIAQYFATTMVIVGLSVIATVWVLQYHYHDPDGGKMPKWVRISLLLVFLPPAPPVVEKAGLSKFNGHRAQQDSAVQRRHFRSFGRLEERGLFRAFQLVVYFGWIR
ncbi:neuronal acetylcholine receptor subunit alpha-7-like [Puntigrus tetrazona]|uniref:neuronal acetylcholine receptor subunit alpha-7-like n=1 Tax=Puntigrus tetrazona TaxID=1606681 RepID=UPI001C8AD25D|nr:neuronal acetylcholine receptor subunit alpha-7-like [Puntigrus tetrazona]